MTNEEAIKALKRIRDEAINNFVGDWQDYEAFGIALKALADRKTEPTISKMEQVDKDTNVRSKYDCETCKHYHPDHEAIACERCLDGKYSRYEPKTEPHTDCAWKKGE